MNKVVILIDYVVNADVISEGIPCFQLYWKYSSAWGTHLAHEHMQGQGLTCGPEAYTFRAIAT